MKRVPLLVLLLTPLLSFAAPTVGMCAHLPSASDSQLMAQLGVRSARLDFNWFDFEPRQGQFSWQALDAVVTSARANGLSLYATVAYTPQWASIDPTCTLFASSEVTKCENKRQANPQHWRDAVTAVVTRYRGQVECWGIWNEPNLRTFFDGNQDQFVNEIFLPAAQAIRAADPAAKICGPELAGLTASSNWNGRQGTCVAGSCIRNGWERDLGQLLTRVGSHLDVVTHHVYKADAAGVMRALLDGETVGGVLTHDSVKHVIEANGAGGKEFWLTETGWEHPPQGGTSLPDVATRIVDLYTKQEEVCAGSYAGSLVDPWRNWTRTWYFHFPYDPGSGWGVVDSNAQPLAPYSALQNWTRGRVTTACTFGLSAVDGGVVAPDAGTRPDAGSPRDAGALVDAGSAVEVDAGSQVADAGSASLDAGAPTADASTADAGAPAADAGTSGSDAGTSGPLQRQPLPEPTGCGCGGTNAGAVLLLTALLPGRRRRRAGVPSGPR